MTTVIHMRDFDRNDPTHVRVDRTTRWGNPYKLINGTPANRAEVIKRYADWIVQQPTLMAALPELRDKKLACFCFPKACHADVLAELANADQAVTLKLDQLRLSDADQA